MVRKVTGAAARKGGHKVFEGISTSCLRIACFLAMGMETKEICRRCDVKEQMVGNVRRRPEVRDHLLPCLRAIMRDSNRVVIGGEEADEYLMGTSRRTVQRLLAIQSVTPSDFYDENGVSLRPQDLDERLRMAVAGVEEKVIEMGSAKEPDKRLVFKYQLHSWSNAAEQLCGILGIDVSKGAVDKQVKRIKSGETKEIARVDFGRRGSI